MKKIVIITLVLIFGIGMSFAGGGTEADSASESSEQELQVQNGDGHYPIDIITYDYARNEVITTYEKAPEKVLAIYQGSIETMLALGLEDHMIAGASLDDPVKDEWQKAFATINYLGPNRPSKEDVIMMQPDMILSWRSHFSDDRLGDVYYWHESGINTYTNTNTSKGGDSILENEYSDILNLGKIFNVEEKANELVNQMKAEIERAQKIANNLKDERTVLLIEFFTSSIRNYGATSLGGNMIISLGGKMLQPVSGNLSKENIVELNPDVIFISYMVGEDEEEVAYQKYIDMVLKDPALASLQAIETENVVPITLGDMYASGVRTMDGISKFANGIYPEL